MTQNIIAMIWDFDKTLINGYMQDPIFKRYGVDGEKFWQEVMSLPKEYEEKGIRVNRDTYYLNHILNYVKNDKFKGLNNHMLREMGKDLEFFNGLPEFFEEIQDLIEKEDKYKRHDIKLEHYIVSTGLTEMIKGSKIYDYAEAVWGCEFIEEDGILSQIAYAIDNTSKTRAIYEINKGTNYYEKIDVNSSISSEDRRVPIKNMLYIADGPSDVPVFSVVKKNGGKTFAVYRKGNQEEFAQVDQLRADGRVDMFGEADYTKDKVTHMWLSNEVKKLADRIYEEKEDQLAKSFSEAPRHLI